MHDEPVASAVASGSAVFTWAPIGCMGATLVSVGLPVVVGVLVALVEPAAEAGGVGVHAVERLQLLALGRVDPHEVVGERGVEGGGDVVPRQPRPLGDLGPQPQRALGLL